MVSRLTLVREAMGISQTELAHKLRLTQGYISNIEKGHRNPSEDTQRRIARTLGVEREIIFRED